MRDVEVTRRQVLGAGLGFGALLGLAACGAGGGSGSSSGGGSQTATGAASGSASDAFLQTAGSKAGAKSISVLAYAAPQGDALKAMISQFEKATGITVNWTSLAEQAAAGKAAVALGSGTGSYDIVQVTSALMPSYASRKWLASLDTLAQDASMKIPGWDKSVYGATSDALMSYQGTMYASPMFVGTQIFYYRTDVFDKKGVTTLPTTFDELRDVCDKIHGSDTAAIALRSAPSPSQMMFVWSAWLYAYGGKYYQSYNNGNYSGNALDSDAAVKALTLYSTLLRNYAPTGATNWSVEDVSRAFTTGRIAITQEGAVFGGTFNNPKQSQVAGKVGTFVIPKGSAGNFVPFNNHGWGVAANSAKQKAAWLFVQWATLQSTLTAATQNSVGFSTPPIAAVYQTSAYQKRYGFDDYVKNEAATINIANNGGVSPFKGDPNYLPGTTKWATLGQNVCEKLTLAITGQASPQSAVEQAAEAMGS